MRRYPSIRRCEHKSSYWMGGRSLYGRYQWDVKYYGWEDEIEIEIVAAHFLGGQTKNGYEVIDEIVGRPVNCFFEGRSGGWLVIDTKLTEKELKKVDKFIERSMKEIPKLLKSIRQGWEKLR